MSNVCPTVLPQKSSCLQRNMRKRAWAVRPPGPYSYDLNAFGRNVEINPEILTSLCYTCCCGFSLSHFPMALILCFLTTIGLQPLRLWYFRAVFGSTSSPSCDQYCTCVQTAGPLGTSAAAFCTFRPRKQELQKAVVVMAMALCLLHLNFIYFESTRLGPSTLFYILCSTRLGPMWYWSGLARSASGLTRCGTMWHHVAPQAPLQSTAVWSSWKHMETHQTRNHLNTEIQKEISVVLSVSARNTVNGASQESTNWQWAVQVLGKAPSPESLIVTDSYG